MDNKKLNTSTPITSNSATITENTFQSKLFFALSRCELERKDMFVFAIPNGDVRDIRTAVRLKSTGVRPGVSDMCVIGGGRVMWIECKRDNCRQSDAQIRFADKCASNGMVYLLARPEMGVDQVVDQVVAELYK